MVGESTYGLSDSQVTPTGRCRAFTIYVLQVPIQLGQDFGKNAVVPYGLEIGNCSSFCVARLYPAKAG